MSLAKTQAESASRAKTRFLASISHELRTPLNAILGLSEALVMGAFGPLTQERMIVYIKDIHHSGRHLLDLINALLDVSKIEEGRLELDMADLDVGVLFGECLAVARQLSGGRHDIAMSLAPGAAWVRADARTLRQILINLLGNAVKFTPEVGSIRLSAEPGPAGVRLTVADTGIGIGQEVINALGQPFTRGSSAFVRQQEGAGLGLFICRSLVELHGGTLTLTRWPEGGTLATVDLPAPQAAAAD